MTILKLYYSKNINESFIFIYAEQLFTTNLNDTLMETQATNTAVTNDTTSKSCASWKQGNNN